MVGIKHPRREVVLVVVPQKMSQGVPFRVGTGVSAEVGGGKRPDVFLAKWFGVGQRESKGH